MNFVKSAGVKDLTNIMSEVGLLAHVDCRGKFVSISKQQHFAYESVLRHIVVSMNFPDLGKHTASLMAYFAKMPFTGDFSIAFGKTMLEKT